jgi:hypothetical protein
MDRNELPLEPRHLGVPLSASKIIFEPMVRLTQTVHLPCTDTNNVSKRTEQDSTWPTSLRISIGCVQNYFRAYGTFGAIHAPILRQD